MIDHTETAVPAEAPAPGAADSRRLGPAGAFPATLEGLTVEELQILHSRLCLQLDHEYLTDPAGPHPVSLDRYRQVVTALGGGARSWPRATSFATGLNEYC
jgi:hypothetical protein